MLELMDALEIDARHMVGNSMGGRVAIEVGLRAPGARRRARAAVPGGRVRKRGLHPIVRLLRPEFGLLPTASAAARVERQFWRCSATAT